MPRLIADMARRPRVSGADGRLFGMEIEAEGMTPAEVHEREWPSGTMRHWNVVEDGSLRNGSEFVSLPLTQEFLRGAVQHLYRGAFGPDLFHPSVRTGIHIHASCMFMDTDQVLRIGQHYALLEPLMFKAVGGQRDENIYCIPWYRAHDTPRAVFGVFAENREYELCKYTALHYAPLFKYGTLEYRHAPTFETAGEACEWLDLVAALHATWQTTYDVLDEWYRLGPSAFAERVFGRDLGWEPEYDALEVDRVCELLRPPKPVVHDGWGFPPMLKGEGTVAVPMRPLRARRVNAAGADTIADILDRARIYTSDPAERITLVSSTDMSEAVWNVEGEPSPLPPIEHHDGEDEVEDDDFLMDWADEDEEEFAEQP